MLPDADPGTTRLSGTLSVERNSTFSGGGNRPHDVGHLAGHSGGAARDSAGAAGRDPRYPPGPTQRTERLPLAAGDYAGRVCWGARGNGPRLRLAMIRVGLAAALAGLITIARLPHTPQRASGF